MVTFSIFNVPCFITCKCYLLSMSNLEIGVLTSFHLRMDITSLCVMHIDSVIENVCVQLKGKT